MVDSAIYTNNDIMMIDVGVGIFETNFDKIVTQIPQLQEFFFKTLKLPGALPPGPPC